MNLKKKKNIFRKIFNFEKERRKECLNHVLNKITSQILPAFIGLVGKISYLTVTEDPEDVALFLCEIGVDVISSSLHVNAYASADSLPQEVDSSDVGRVPF